MPVLTMALGLAVQQCGGPKLRACNRDIRWPNDVILNEKKLAGILVQQPIKGALIAGIGINVGQRAFPEDLRSHRNFAADRDGRRVFERGSARTHRGRSRCVMRIRSRSEGKAEIFRRFEAVSHSRAGKTVEVDGSIRRRYGRA